MDGVDLSDLPPLPGDLPPLPDGAAPATKDPQRPPYVKPDRGAVLPPLPERSLGLDLSHEAAGMLSAAMHEKCHGMAIRGCRQVRQCEDGRRLRPPTRYQLARSTHAPP